MKHVAWLLCFFTCLGCKEITFENPQPEGKKSLTAIPKNLRGKYVAIGDDGEPSKDTVIIDQRGYRFGYYDPADRMHLNDEYETGILSDTLVMKSYKGYYFISMKEGSEWLLRVIKRERSGDLIYMAMEKNRTDFRDYVSKLAMEIKVDSFPVAGNMVYRIDPSPGELIDLIEKGYFSELRLVKLH